MPLVYERRAQKQKWPDQSGKIMESLDITSGQKKLQKPISYGDNESVISDDSSSPKSIDSEYSFETTESSLEDEQGQYTSDESRASSRLSRQSSIVDGLLTEIYDRYHHGSRSGDSDNVTECSTTSLYSGSFELDERTQRWTRSQLNGKDLGEIRRVSDELSSYVTLLSGRLIRQLKRRDKNAYKLQRNFDILTAILQAVSLKRRIDTRIKFSFIPQSGKKGFRQWLDSFKAVSRLPQGVPSPWRKRLWLILAESKLGHLDWKKTCQFCFNERSNPDDDNLGAQIVKDLHRTGCSWFCEFETPEERAVLKRVLLAYARWNKAVGYCQGFNVIAALILQVMDRSEEDALKVMVYLVDFVLPANYFSNNLRSLSVDMAVLRELMKIKLPDLSDHLQNLQRQATAHNNTDSNSHEPPLTNVFTMQWFLTLFATCLPEQLVLRVWDCILLEGSEVLLRVALAIWAAIGLQLEDLESADEFYGAMGRILAQIQEGILINDTSLMSMVYSMAPFPFPKIVELREKYTYNIHPLSNNLSPEKRVKFNQKTKNGYISSDDEDDDVSQLHIGCLGILSPKTTSEGSAHKVRHSGGYPFTLNFGKPTNGSDNVPRRSRPPVDVSDLEKEYNRTRKMQQQAVVVFSQSNASKSQDLREIPPAINHLFVVTRARRNKWKEHLQKERQRQDKLLPVHEEEEDWERGHVEKHANEHVTDAAEHLVGLFKGATTDESPPCDQDRTLEENLVANLDIGVSLTDQNTLPKSLKSSKDLNTFKIVRYSNPSNSLKTTRDKSRTKAVKTSLSISSVDPSLVLPDKKCIYPAKFFPFPGTRTKVSNNGLLCSKRTETEQPAKKQSFISGPPMPCQARTNR